MVPETSSQLSVVAVCWVLATGYRVLLFFLAMWGSRWTAGFLLLVMLAPAFGPVAMARVAPPEAMHCMRQPVAGHSAQPAMPCHHGMAPATQADTSDASFQAVNGCCQNHDCCRGATTREWAQPASSLLSVFSLLIEPARLSQGVVLHSSDISGCDSARAPPHS